jgi:hypothetical protein
MLPHPHPPSMTHRPWPGYKRYIIFLDQAGAFCSSPVHPGQQERQESSAGGFCVVVQQGKICYKCVTF